MLITEKSFVRQQVIKNLLSAHKRIAESENGNTHDLICISRYLLRLTKKSDDVLIDAIAKSDQQWSSDPVDKLDNFQKDTISTNPKICE